MKEYKEFKGCKFKLGERVRVISKEELKKIEKEHRDSYNYLYNITSKTGIIVDKLSGYVLQMDDNSLNNYYDKYTTRHMGKCSIFNSTVKEEFLLPYSKNKRLT